MRAEILTTAHAGSDRRLRWIGETLASHGIPTGLRGAEFGGRVARFVLGPWWAAWRTLASKADVVVVPDPEAWFAASAAGRLVGRRVVIDVHEEYHLTARSRGWIPGWARGLVGAVARMALGAGRRLASAVLVADEHLAGSGDHVVRNVPDVVPSERREVEPTAVYVGSVSRQRGVGTIVDLARARPGWTFWIIGPEGEGAEDARRRASTNVVWHGPLDHGPAWALAGRAWVGLSLLGDEPAYRRALPTKVVEYLGVGLPVVVSDLPRQASLVRAAGAGVVVSGVDEAAGALDRMATFREVEAMGRRARAAYERLTGADDAAVRLLEAINPAR